jgi:hypothetical protein
MELTEEMLRRIANTIGELRLRIVLTQVMALVTKETREELEEVVKKTQETPEFQEACDEIFAQLKGNP